MHIAKITVSKNMDSIRNIC